MEDEREKQNRKKEDEDEYSRKKCEHLVPMVGKSMGLADPGREPRLARGYPLFGQVLEKRREEVGGTGIDDNEAKSVNQTKRHTTTEVTRHRGKQIKIAKVTQRHAAPNATTETPKPAHSAHIPILRPVMNCPNSFSLDFGHEVTMEVSKVGVAREPKIQRGKNRSTHPTSSFSSAWSRGGQIHGPG